MQPLLYPDSLKVSRWENDGLNVGNLSVWIQMSYLRIIELIITMFVCSISYLLFIPCNLNSYSCPHVNILYFPAIHCASDTTKENSYDVFSPIDFLNIWTIRAWPTTSAVKLIRNRTYTISSSLSLLVGLTQVLQNIIHTVLSGAYKKV